MNNLRQRTRAESEAASVCRTRIAVVALLVVLLSCAAGACRGQDNAKPWAFAAISDTHRALSRAAGAYEAVLAEIRDMKTNPAPRFPPIEFVLACGDLQNTADDCRNWNLWLDAFKNAALKPCYFPVLGNWDAEDIGFNRKIILPAQKGVVGTDPRKYYVDWKNIRLIIGRDRAYVEKAITTAPETVQHIFVASHYPIFPRHYHLDPPDREDIAFWKMLVDHRDRVRAFFCGHTHYYCRMRVADAAGPAATDMRSFPDEAGGIYQIQCGSAGRSGREPASTIVEIMVDGANLKFRVLQAPHASPDEFKVVDKWEFKTAPATGKQ